MTKSLTRKSAGITATRPVKVLQFGEGNFLRAFVDWIVDILNEQVGFNGNVEIVQPINRGMAAMVNEQEGLYHVILNGIKNGQPSREIRLVTCVSKAINPYLELNAYLKSAENPDLAFVVSNTTEAGIAFDANDTSHETLPNSFPGKLTMFMYHRFNHFNGAPDKGVTFLPCELIDKNGDALKATILKYIQHWNLPASFEQWIKAHNAFCNTLVDRIVPGFPKETIRDIHKETGFEDNLVVMAESFHLWVIEGPDSLQQSLPADKAGLQVKFVRDMAPYRTRKVRILNGAHTAMVPVAYLHGFRTVRDSVEDELMGSFIRQAIFEEIIPTLDLPEEELKQFANDVIERFQNPFIRHELSSIALNSISKYKVRVLPSLIEYAKRKGQIPERLSFSLAALIRFYRGAWKDESLPVNDTPEIINFFKEVWTHKETAAIVHAVLANTSLWDEDLNKVKGLTEKLISHLNYIQESEEGIGVMWPLQVTK